MDVELHPVEWYDVTPSIARTITGPERFDYAKLRLRFVEIEGCLLAVMNTDYDLAIADAEAAHWRMYGKPNGAPWFRRSRGGNYMTFYDVGVHA